MRIIILILCFLPFCVCAAALRLCQESDAEDPDLPVFTVNNESFHGEHAAIVAHALGQLNQAFSLVRLPWRRCMSLVENGVFDGVVGMGWSPERHDKFMFPQTANQLADEAIRLSYTNYPVYVLAGSALAWDGITFSNIKSGIAAPKGFLVAKQLKALGVLQETDVGVDLGLSLLKKQRIDAVVLSEIVGDRMLANEGSGSIKKLDQPFYRQAVFLVFSLKQQTLDAEKIQAVWQQIPLSRAEIATTDSH